jgi:hypothetical protein
VPCGLFVERSLKKLDLDRVTEQFTDAVGLWLAGLGFSVILVLDY